VGDAGWTYAHDQGRLAMEKELGAKVKTTFVESVPEGADAERVIRKLVARQQADFHHLVRLHEPDRESGQVHAGRGVPARHRLQARTSALTKRVCTKALI
jgi:hypothetical protein